MMQVLRAMLSRLSGGAKTPPALRVHEFTLPSIDGEPTSLGVFRGKVLLLVNVASQCGLTPQYTALEALQRQYRERGLTVLAFPANNFFSQEPGSEPEIKEFCTSKYQVSFPLFSKISVRGSDQAPLYRFLTRLKKPLGGRIRWNFTKFLVDRQGFVIARFAPRTRPDSPEVVAAIENALKESPALQHASI